MSWTTKSSIENAKCMFAMACIDRMEIEERRKRQSERTGGEPGRKEEGGVQYTDNMQQN